MIVTLLGTKGGTGTTTVAVNCAANIRRLSNRPTLVCDVKAGPGDVAVFLGLRPRYTVVDLIDQLGWSDKALASRFIAEHDSGLHVLAASDGFGRPAQRDTEALEQILRCYASLYDFVIIDAGSTLSTPIASALTMSDVVLLVTNPDVPCLRNLQRYADALRLVGVASERVRVVLNRTSGNGVLSVGQIEKALTRRIDYQLPSDYRTVATAINTGVPISCLRVSDLQLQIDSMARTLIGSVAQMAS
jgi:pilus assembly protein CpaE